MPYLEYVQPLTTVHEDWEEVEETGWQRSPVKIHWPIFEPTLRGWECPKCGRCYSPWTPHCAYCMPFYDIKAASNIKEYGEESD